MHPFKTHTRAHTHIQIREIALKVSIHPFTTTKYDTRSSL